MAKIKILGDVRVLLEGRFEEKYLQPIDQRTFRFALGAGVVTDIQSFGETIVIEGKPFTTWYEGGKRVTGTTCRSPFLVGVEWDQKGMFEYRQYEKPISMGAIYEELAANYAGGFAIAAIAKMEELYGRWVTKPPVNLEPFLSTVTDVEMEKEKTIFLFGVVIPKHTEELNRAFYQDMQQTEKHELLNHTHAAFLRKQEIPKTEQEFHAAVKEVEMVAHFMTHSLIQEGAFVIYPL